MHSMSILQCVCSNNATCISHCNVWSLDGNSTTFHKQLGATKDCESVISNYGLHYITTMGYRIVSSSSSTSK